MTRFTVLLPAYNEATALPGVLENLTKILPTGAYEVLVIDDGSVDRTSQVVPPAVRLIRHAENRGHGAAIKTGLDSAKEDVIVIFDADGQHHAEDISKLIERLSQGYDLVVGARRNLSGQRRGWGNVVLSFCAGLLAGMRIPDITSGLRVIRKNAAQKFAHLYPDHFCFEVTSTMALAMTGHKVDFLDIEPRMRQGGQSKIRVGFDGVKFLAHMIFLTRLYRPFRLFLGILGFLLVYTGWLTMRSESLDVFHMGVQWIFVFVAFWAIRPTYNYVVFYRRQRSRSGRPPGSERSFSSGYHRSNEPTCPSIMPARPNSRSPIVRRSPLQKTLDFVTFPVRAVSLLFEDRFGLSCLATERFDYVAREVKGKCLDIGCGRHNTFVKRFLKEPGVGIDVFPYEGLTKENLVDDMTHLPFADAHFDSVTFIANINHIPESLRDAELSEAHRVLRPGGNVVVTMGNGLAEVVMHKLVEFYDHALGTHLDVDSERGMHEDEQYYLTDREIVERLSKAGFTKIEKKYFLTQWCLNHLFVGWKEPSRS